TSSSKYLETLRTVYRKASNEGVTDQLTNPFQNFKIQRGQVKKDRLTEEEIQAIIELKLEEGSLIWHVRNSFLFSFYCAGIRASDILQLKWKNIIDGRLVYKMQKTNRPHTMKLHDKAKAILDYYGPRDPENFVFSYLDNNVDYSDPEFAFNQLNSKTVLLNKYLGKIAKMSEIEKRVTTHTARHSFADIARQKTDNLYNLSKTLGHSSIKITEAYLASFDEKAVDDTLDEVFK
ncbi:MAG: site-specific integrase, partial [Candidatus Paceibacterota bacterium]